ncbi:MAG: hypothetical protein A3I14_00695 [Candidatus Rokubacteria bacterium RIFCSPLOWO2_02_FULL_73_56]|nr:MAG: hypothetical protein A3I14_00695 [Candidatus Rokubacteria bacterium RIFCSPLOWO2_02_FULL_73_56]OGL25561.1 MAG: hypothetical protein A3G44_09930 [Candidatus Rokubacteria bacterium RIFCSPLOWO2_12_FULL_73_47]
MRRRTLVRAGVTAAGLGSLPLYGLDLHARVGADLGVLAVYVALFAGLFGLYLLTAWAVLARPARDPLVLALVLGFGLAFRVAVLPTPVVLSSDVYRYLWDGRVQRAGINPYRHPPAAPELRPLRDARIHAAINRPAAPTIYPPGAQAAFLAVTWLAPDSLLAWRGFLLLCELATGVLLLRLLDRLAVPREAIILYAWAPLAVFEGVQAGHLEVAVLPALLLALLWRQDGRMLRAGAALGVAVLVKLYPAVLLLAWWRRGDRRLPAACAVVVAAGYLPYLAGAGAGVVGFLPAYFTRAEDFNVGLRHFLTAAVGLGGEGPRAVAMLGLLALLLGVLLRIRREATDDAAGVFRAGMAAASAYLVLVPTSMHPWYAVFILPFVAVSPSPAWVWFTGAVSLSYLAYAWLPAPFPLWLRAVEWAPLWALLLVDLRAWPRAFLPRRARVEGVAAEPEVAVAIMAKAPVAGAVKTRLCPPLAPGQAAALARCFLLDKLGQLRTLRGARPVVAFSPADAADLFRALAPGVDLLAQRGPDLGARLAAVLGDLLARGAPAAIAVDSDTPSLPAAFVQMAVDRLADPAVDLVLGPSEDGGYYLIGMPRVHGALFAAMPWSTPDVLAETERRARAAGLRVVRLPVWFDVDTAADLERLRAALARGEGAPAPATRALLAAWRATAPA